MNPNLNEPSFVRTAAGLAGPVELRLERENQNLYKGAVQIALLMILMSKRTIDV